MKKNNKISRPDIMAYLLTGVMLLIVARLFYMQVIQHDHYVSLASKEQVKRLVIPAKRGLIYGLNKGEPTVLAMNQEVYTAFADPTVVRDIEAVDKVMQKVAKDAIVVDDIPKLLSDKKSQYKVLARKLTLRQAQAIKNQNLKGVGFHKVSQRVYPEGTIAAQVLGYINNEGTGVYGVEQEMNDRLSGEDGVLKSVTDVANVPLSIGDDSIRTPAKDGDNIVLSIDVAVQSKAEEALKNGLKKAGASNGSVIVLDPNTGRVMAMASYPSFDPAKFWEVKDAEQFVNGAVARPYEAGSVIKTFTIATGIDKGAITADSTFYNTDTIKVEDRTIGNAYRGMTGTLTMQQALNNSLNTGMVTIAQRLGDGKRITKGARNTMYDYFHNRFGLGQKTGVEVTGEATGTVISPEEIEGNAVRYSNMAFGQGMNVTMLQVATGFSAIANGGVYHSPTVLAGVVDDDGVYQKNNPEDTARRILQKSAADQARTMIYQARQSYTSDPSGYYIGGKTGTSETLTSSGYTDSETVGSYLGFGGTKSRSEYVIMVQVSGKNMNLEGGKHAMPIFTDISNWMLQYLQVQPEN